MYMKSSSFKCKYAEMSSLSYFGQATTCFSIIAYLRVSHMVGETSGILRTAASWY